MEGSVEPYAADVTNPAQLAQALDGGFDAVFYTVDIHGRGHSRADLAPAWSRR